MASRHSLPAAYPSPTHTVPDYGDYGLPNAYVEGRDRVGNASSGIGIGIGKGKEGEIYSAASLACPMVGRPPDLPRRLFQ